MRALESTFSKRDSALGEQCGSVAKIVKGTNAKFANLPQFSQSSHSPTAIPRIYEKESRASLRADNALFPSLRDFALAKSWQSTSSKNAKAQNADSRFFTQAAQSLSTPQGKKAESVFSNQPQAAGFLMKSETNLKHKKWILGFAMRKQGEAAVSLVNLCFASACKGAYLGVCNRSTREAIKDLSRKAES